MTTRRAARLAWAAWIVGLGLRIVQLWIATRATPSGIDSFGLDIRTHVAAALLGTTAATVGAIILTQRPRSLIGWLTAFAGILQGVIGATNAYAARALAEGPTPGVITLAWLDGIALQVVPIAVIAWVVAVFPEGRMLSRRWHAISIAIVVGCGLRFLEIGFGLDRLFLAPAVANPYLAGGDLGRLLAASSGLALGLVILSSGAVAAAVSLAIRYRTAASEVRLQIRWILVASLAAVVGAAPFAVLTIRRAEPDQTEWALTLLFVTANLVPLALLVAITRYRLHEIDRIINRTVLYGSLTAILAGVFTAGVGLAQRLFVAFTRESSDAALVVTTLVVATLYAPLRKRLESIIDRRFKFEGALLGAYRDELQRLLSLTDHGRAAQRLVDELARDLDLRGAALLDRTGAVVASAGAWPMDGAVRMPAAGFGAGATLAIGPRRNGRPIDAALLGELDAVVGLAGRAVARY